MAVAVARLRKSVDAVSRSLSNGLKGAVRLRIAWVVDACRFLLCLLLVACCLSFFLVYVVCFCLQLAF